MADSSKPARPAPGAFPFMPFPLPGFAPAAAPPPAGAGSDLFASFWANLPGTSQLPGFLVPTVDVDELDKRIADLRAAESWVEVNLNLLRATIQGLEVQRHTIAALRSFTASPAPAPVPTAKATMPHSPAAAKIPAPAAPSPTSPSAGPGAAPAAPAALAAGQWLGYLQDQFARVAGAALAGTATPSAKAAAKTATTTRAAARKQPRRAA